jgi:tetratricopeptide (TPR) repeat protein
MRAERRNRHPFDNRVCVGAGTCDSDSGIQLIFVVALLLGVALLIFLDCSKKPVGKKKASDSAHQTSSASNMGTVNKETGAKRKPVQSPCRVSYLGSSPTNDSPKCPLGTEPAPDTPLPPFSTLGIRYGKLDDVIELLGGEDALWDLSTDEVCTKYLKPLTKQSGLSLCEQLQCSEPADSAQSTVAEANWFISHAWSYKFMDVIEAISEFMEKEYDAYTREDVVIWFDMFSNSQHSTQNKPFEWWRGTFMNAVRKLGNVLMVLDPWDNPVTLTRAWCIIELLACELTQSRFAVSMSKAEAARFASCLTEEGIAKVFHGMLSRVNSSKSEARSASDRQNIHDAVRHLLPDGFAALDSMVLRVFEKWMIAHLKERITSELGIDVREKLDLAECLKEWNYENVDVLRLVVALAALYHTVGQHKAAEPLFRLCTEHGNRMLGPDHPITLTSINSLAGIYMTQGKYDAAEPLFHQCMEGRSRTLGGEHPDTLTIINNLAGLYRTQGKYDVAEPLLQRCIEGQSRVLGGEHQDTLMSINNLALVYWDQGNYGAAEPLYLECAEKGSRVLGEDHPDTLLNVNNLAMLYTAQGHYGDAEPLQRRCMESNIRLLGPAHPDTLTSINNLGALYKVQGKYDEAQPLFQRCVESRSRTLGAEHPDTLTSISNLAGLYRVQGNYDIAEPLCRQCMESRSRVLGAEHPDTLTSVNNLALLYWAQGNYEAAEPLYLRCLEIQSRVLGAEHPDTLTCVNNLGMLYKAQGKYDEAEPLLQRCYQTRCIVLGEEHPATMSSLNNLAALYA